MNNMKSRFKIFYFILAIIFFSNCSSSVNYNLQFVSKSAYNNNTEVHNYKYNFENNAWMEILAFVKQEDLKYTISINSPSNSSIDTYTYNEGMQSYNFRASNRVKAETVSGLDEAIKKAITFYLADNI